MSKLPSTTHAQNRFAQIPGPQIQRSSFNRSCGHKTTFSSGYLVPIFVDEALPGDTMSMQATMFGRISTLLQPIMDNVYLDTFYFAVPLRLVWDNFEKFMGAQDNPGDSTDFTIPIINSDGAGYAEGSIFDYLGLPTKVTTSYQHSALFNRAYALIWNEWFRDQNLQNSQLVNSSSDGPDLPSVYSLLKRGKRHDYFTSALPWPQKGDSVTLPLGTTAPVVPTGDGRPTFDVGTSLGHNIHGSSSSSAVTFAGAPTDTMDANWDDPKLEVDLSSATAATINQIRQSFQIQKLLERDARGGTRYTEIVRSHFGVTSPDQRLQRPEYLGGGSQPLFVREQVSMTSIGTEDLGDFGGTGTFTDINRPWTKSFNEHCIIIGLVSARADLNYQQGLERMWSRSTKHDFYWPSLAHLGEQAVLSKELFTDGSANDEDVFGYQERFAEYRYKPSRVSGEMRSNATASLDIWHLAQDFATRPVLDEIFIRETPPLARVIATPTKPEFLLDMFFNYKCARPMPVFSVPGLIDHF